MVGNIDIHKILKQHFGFDKFRGNQEAIIRNVLNNNDSFVLMPTGGGKSLCYQLPALISEGTCIIISPLIALMKNQVDLIRSWSSDEGIAHYFNSSLSKSASDQVKKDLLDGKTKLIYVAPESLTKEENIKMFKKIKISFYAIDEAHCISEWGHDFRPEYRKIRSIIEQIGIASIITLTATATQKVQDDIQKNLNILDAKVFKSSFNRPNLFYEIHSKANVTKDIIKYIRLNQGKSGIIYCLSRKSVESLAETLQINDIKALPYHAGLDGKTRSNNQDQFLMEKIDVIVATIAFGMGIDKPDVRYVMHYDAPKSVEGYYQETGRAGRDGGEGKCILFYSHKDIERLEKLTQGKPVAEREITFQLLLEVSAYAESSICRRKLLLYYFGEEYENDNCNNCDNCISPKTFIDGKEHIKSYLEIILELKEKHKGGHIVDFLIGKDSSTIKAYKYDELLNFGKHKDKDENFWKAIDRQAQIIGLVKKDIEEYGVVKITPEGKKFLEEPFTIKISENQNYDDIETNFVTSGETDSLDPVLLLMLKKLRERIAKETNVPPYVVFQESSLTAMCTYYPTKESEFLQIQGVSQGKYTKYGVKFKNIIVKYVEENNIERPQDILIRSVANKSKFKIQLIRSIDSKIMLEDIANSQGIEFDELINEIETIVYSGTKLNLNYYITQILDEKKVDNIYEYFSTAEHDNIPAAMEELGEDEYEENEIRLVRVKFLSEMAN